MLCIFSFEAHPNFESTLQLIRGEGKKAKGSNFYTQNTMITNNTVDWLADKESAGFVIPALYFPKSLMPSEVWKASPTTTNGNEQAHLNINCNGISLTLLRGVMHGQDYDTWVNKSIKAHLIYGIQTRDRASTETILRQSWLNEKHGYEDMMIDNVDDEDETCKWQIDSCDMEHRQAPC